MPFYVQDWLSSTLVNSMILAEQGAFARLLCHAWSDPDCTLPDNDEALARLSGLGDIWKNGSSEVLRRAFIPHPSIKGRIYNPRQLREREKQSQRQAVARDKATKAAEARWSRKAVLQDNCHTPAMPVHDSSNPSSLVPRRPSLNEFNRSGALSTDLCMEWKTVNRYLTNLLGKETMANWGGRWCNRWKKCPKKFQRVFREIEANIKEGKNIGNMGGYADDLWKRFVD